MMHDWSQVRGNKFAVKPCIDMLLKEGFVRHATCFLKGETYCNGGATRKSIRYDVDYVVAKLKREFLDPMHCEDLTELQQLISKALKLKEQGD